MSLRKLLIPAAVACAVMLPPALGTALAQAHTSAPGRARPPRGPLEIRDDHLLAQGRLTLPAVSPQTLRKGAWSLDLSLLWSNSFAWTQDVPGEDPEERRFLIDGEAVTLAADLRLGLGADLDVGLRLPLKHRGGGRLDRFIDAWHRLFNLEDAARPQFNRDAFRVEGLTHAGVPFEWVDADGTALGDIEANLRWRAVRGQGTRPSLALVGRVSLPTGTDPFGESGFGVAGQVVASFPIGETADLYAGAGLTVQDPGPVRGLEYARTRGHGFLALEWRPFDRLSLVVESNAATRLVESIQSYPGTHWLVNVEGRLDLGRTTRLDVGLTENLIHQQATTDLGLYFALGWRP